MKKFYNKNKNKINIFILILITILVLYFSLKDDFNSIVNQILNIDIKYLLITFVIIICFWLLRSITLHRFTKKFKNDNK